MSEDEEEDWFERAMREAESGDEADSESQADAASDEDADTDDSTAAQEPTDGEGSEDAAVAASESEADQDAEADDSAPDADEAASDPFGGIAGGAGDGDPFGGVAADREGATESDPFGGSGFEEGFGGREGGRDPIPEEGFEEEAVTEPQSFDEAELDSDIDRVDVGIEGLDEMVLGGIPRRSLMVAIGAAGTGKTTFGLQFLTETLENGGRGIYITLEESREAILSTAEEKGWPFRRWRDEGQLAIVAMDPIEMANSLSSIRNDISRLVEEF
ncbi:MAG: RAD55 family ATPase, partial [Halolamina sp.]